MNIYDVNTRISELNEEIRNLREHIKNCESYLIDTFTRLDEGDYELFKQYQYDYDKYMETLEDYDNSVKRHNELIDEQKVYLEFQEGVE